MERRRNGGAMLVSAANPITLIVRLRSVAMVRGAEPLSA